VSSDKESSTHSGESVGRRFPLANFLRLIFFTTSQTHFSPSSIAPISKTTGPTPSKSCALLPEDIRQDRQTEPRSDSEIADKSPTSIKKLNSFWDLVTVTNDTGDSFVSSANFHKVVAWLHHCSTNAIEHTHCQAPTGRLPTRVINVFLSNSNQEQNLCTLYVSKGEKEKYLALSHC
jgi:hypothetical protein